MAKNNVDSLFGEVELDLKRLIKLTLVKTLYFPFTGYSTEHSLQRKGKEISHVKIVC